MTSRILSSLCQNVRIFKTNKMTFSKYRASPFVFELSAENHEKIQILGFFKFFINQSFLMNHGRAIH